MITLINGFPQGPNGLIVPNGSVVFQLNIDATVVAAPGGFVCADIPVVFQFDANGALIQPAQLWSNEELNPQLSPTLLGTYYLVTFYDQNGARLNVSPMWWQFPELNGATVDISQMTPVSTVGGNVIYYPTAFTGGTVTSISLTGDGVLFSGTPGAVITSSGSLLMAPLIIAQTPNFVFAGPATGSSPANPTFRALVAADLPTITVAVAPAATLNLTSQSTLRLTDSEISTIFAGSTTIAGSIAAVRGAITQASANTLASGFEYGVQGKLILAGTLANGSGFNAGVFGQLDTSPSTFVHTSGYLAPIMGDFGSSANLATDANANMVALLNTTNCLIHSAILFTGNASYAFDFSDLAFGGKHFITTGASGGTNAKCLVVLIDGTPMKIQLYA
jgi:hypothetical protein